LIPVIARPAATRLAALPPLALYVHFPWCLRKCPYCDFNSHEARGAIPEDDYLAALVADLEAALPRVWGRPVGSIFIGGGTPSLLSVAGVDRLLAAIRARLAVAPDAEVTLEANPGAIEAEKFAGFRNAGVSRLSLGIQSFDEVRLRALGRVHSADEAKRAAELALRHFDRVNLDLMYALPEQSLAAARRDLETAIGLGAGHLSAYHLTVEPNTAFHHAPPPLPDEDLAADMQELVEATLAAAGYGHYETSAFARPGQRCRHNLNYWTYGDYLGIGAGAHGKISLPDRVCREMRHRHPARYLQGGDFIQESHEVAAADRAGEFMMNALRLVEGFAPQLFEERTGLPTADIAAAARRAERDGLLEILPDRIRPTLLGQRHLNALIGRFF
jgi:oxygen-independent coproporphyrinogen-3 oxidase